MNPVVLIATHNRIDITTRNIESLLRQSIKPKIILVVTDPDEGDYIMAELNHFRSIVRIVYKSNEPLGSKWQSGINSFFERSHNHTNDLPDPLIICGSDDILGSGFIENACRLVEAGNHFIGIRRWWQHHNGRGYYCQYMAGDNLPLGGARVYSAKMLEAMNYQVFDVTKDRHLDDYGWEQARKSGLKCLVLNEPEKEGLSIHAIKGDWPVMNQFTLKHKNIRLLRSQESKKVLPDFRWDDLHS